MKNLLSYFNSENCTDSRTDFEIVHFTDAQLVHDICVLESQQKQLIAFFAFRYVNNNNGLVQKVNAIVYIFVWKRIENEQSIKFNNYNTFFNS